MRIDRTLLLTGMMTVCALALAAAAAPQGEAGAPAPRRKPIEIHFGVIDPPVVAQRGINVVHKASNLATEVNPLECAGFRWADGKLVILSDRHEHVVFTCAIDLDRMKIESPVAHTIISNEQLLLADGEALALRKRDDGRFVVYAMSSLSNDKQQRPLPSRRQMARFTVGGGAAAVPGEASVMSASPLRDALSKYFDKAGVRPYRTWFEGHSDDDKNTYRWGNVEGITFTPDGKSMLCGMRNPLAGDSAIVFALGGVDEAFDAKDAAKIEITDLFTIDLAGRGISDLHWDAVTKGYLISAARSNGPRLDKDFPFPPSSTDSALYWWSGRKSEKPVQFASVPHMTIEAICRLGDSRYIAIGSDEGDESEGRDHRQSVLTIMSFTGIEK